MTAAVNPLEAKAILRRHMRELRAGIPAPVAAAAALKAAERALGGDLLQPDGEIAVFLSLPGEIDTGPLIAGLLTLGRQLCLPRMSGRDRPLAFHHWQPGEPLELGPMRVREPLPGSPEARPSTLFVPLLAFDLLGHRLGYGGGFYDRSLATLRGCQHVTAIGFAFELQRVDCLPAAAYDQPLDCVVTEVAIHRMPRATG